MPQEIHKNQTNGTERASISHPTNVLPYYIFLSTATQPLPRTVAATVTIHSQAHSIFNLGEVKLSITYAISCVCAIVCECDGCRISRTFKVLNKLKMHSWWQILNSLFSALRCPSRIVYRPLSICLFISPAFRCESRAYFMYANINNKLKFYSTIFIYKGSLPQLSMSSF